MKQLFFPYTSWEDFLHGMYNEDKEGREDRVRMAAAILTSPELCYEQMTRVTKEWTFATLQNLTNPNMNHQAFLGQTACSIYADVHEDETREAWGRLTNEERYKANRIADRVFSEWRARHEKEQGNVFQLSLFEEASI